MRDDDDRQPEVVAELAEQPQDVVPVAGVKRADRLVAEEQLRIDGERAGDRDPLPLAAGNLAGGAAQQRRVEADLGQRAGRAPLDLRLVEAAADPQALADDLGDGEVRVERAQRVLEDELDVPAAPLSPAGGPPQAGDLGAVEGHPSSSRSDQADHGPGQGGLAGPGLADQADDLTRPDLQVDLGQHVVGAPAAAEDHVDAVQREQRLGAGDRSAGQRGGGHRAASSASAADSSSGSPARRQRAWCPGPSRSRSTEPDRHASMAAGQRAANRQPTTSSPICGGWPGMTSELPALEVADRGDPEQGLGVRVPRPVDDLLDRAGLDRLARVEHHYPVAQLPDQREVVGDEQHGQVALVAQVLEELDDLGLDGDVEGGGGLVGDQQPRVAGDGDGDHNPLQHAAGQLGRDLVKDPLGVVQADGGEQLHRLAVRVGPRQPLFHPQHLGQLAADGQVRVQVRCRVLEHRADGGAVQPLPAPARQVGHVFAAERDRALRDGAAGRQHAEGGPAGQRLAAAGLADQADDFADADAQRDAADRDGGPVVHGDVQILDVQYLVRRRFAGHRRPPDLK